MSILPLTMPFTLAVGMLSIPVRVVETRYDKTDDHDDQVILGERMIQAAVDKGGGRRLENIFGGKVGDGDIGLWTEEDLNIADTYAPGEPQLQTYFTYGGFTYRVAGVDPWKDQTGVNVYLGKRHIAQELI